MSVVSMFDLEKALDRIDVAPFDRDRSSFVRRFDYSTDVAVTVQPIKVRWYFLDMHLPEDAALGFSLSVDVGWDAWIEGVADVSRLRFIEELARFLESDRYELKDRTVFVRRCSTLAWAYNAIVGIVAGCIARCVEAEVSS